MRLAIVAALCLVAGAAPATAQSSRVHRIWASGEIARFDDGTRLLIVRQGRHVMTFRIGPDTRFVRQRERDPVDVRTLPEHVGQRVKISYTLISGSRIALRIIVVPDPPPDPRR
jgi:hypothetical protein